ncbi:MAG: glycoside hydrolase [Ignavibacteria bacterium GWB2_35_6b]|nr:MAG: glycoside hydrolase [Ignavibacteria bacterium GWB2_35_6b]
MKKIILLICVFLLGVSQLQSQKIKILTNHEGYNQVGYKNAVVQAYQDDELTNCSIKLYNDDKHIASAQPIKVGKIDRWKNWYFWTIDFSGVEQEGEYYLECETNKGIVRSFPFKIQKDVLERHTISDIITYFRSQRAVGQFEKADSKMTFEKGRKDTIDAHGGWQDASGDYGKHLSHLSFSTYFNPQQIPIVVYGLCKSYELLNKKENENFNQINRRLIDEILYGADYLLRMKNPEGSFYRTVSAPGPGKKAEDRIIVPTMNSFGIKQNKTDSNESRTTLPEEENNIYEVGYRAGAGITIASLAMASQLEVFGDFSSADYLKITEDAFEYLETNNVSLTNDGKENIVDDYCALTAATELYKATGKDVYKKAAGKRAENLITRLTSWKSYNNYWRADDGDRPFFHAADAGLPVTALLYYLDVCTETDKEKILNTVKKSFEFEFAVTSEVPNAFGYARQLVQHKDGGRNSSFFYPHDTETEPWWQGENARLASLAFAARLAVRYFKSDAAFSNKLEQYAINQINWILGLNPYDASMLHGTGRNNPEYMFFGSYQYTNIPGGICNGITSGLNDEHDVDFNLLYSETGKDFDWRWGEQWLPHSAWFLMAVSAGN